MLLFLPQKGRIKSLSSYERARVIPIIRVWYRGVVFAVGRSMVTLQSLCPSFKEIDMSQIPDIIDIKHSINNSKLINNSKSNVLNKVHYKNIL